MRPVSELSGIPPDDLPDYLAEWERESKACKEWQRVPSHSVDVLPAQFLDDLRPEVQLLHKANSLRPKDQEDFEACLPRLDEPARQWLAHALQLAHPGHLWLTELEL